MWVVWVVGEGGVGAHHPTWGFMFFLFSSQQVESFVDIWTLELFPTSTLTVGVVHRHGGMDVVRRGHTVCHRRRKHLSVGTCANYPNDGPACCEGGPSKCDNFFLQMMIWSIKMAMSVAKKTVWYDNCK